MNKLKEKTINLCKELYELKKMELSNKELFKEEIENLSNEIASILDLRDKKGNINPKMVKKPLLKEAFLVFKEFKNNTLEEKIEILEEYLTILKREDVKNSIDKLEKINNNIENNKEEIKAIKKEVELTEEEYEELNNLRVNDKEWLKFIDTVVKEKVNENKENTTQEVKELFPIKEIKNKI